MRSTKHPTSKQVNYAFHLLHKKRLPVDYVNSLHKRIGAFDCDVGKDVGSWLRHMSRKELGKTIDSLKELP